MFKNIITRWYDKHFPVQPGYYSRLDNLDGRA